MQYWKGSKCFLLALDGFAFNFGFKGSKNDRGCLEIVDLPDRYCKLKDVKLSRLKSIIGRIPPGITMGFFGNSSQQNLKFEQDF